MEHTNFFADFVSQLNPTTRIILKILLTSQAPSKPCPPPSVHPKAKRVPDLDRLATRKEKMKAEFCAAPLIVSADLSAIPHTL